MKKNAIKFIIIITLFIISLIGIFNFTDYLSLPKTIFLSGLEESFNDYSNNLNKLKKNEIIKMLNNESLTISMKTNLNINGKYKEIINNTNFETNMMIKKNDNYLYSNTISNYKGKNVLEYEYINNKIFKTRLNYMYYNPDMSIILGSIIKDNINKNIDDDHFTLTKEDININEKIVKCNKVEYKFKGTDLHKMYKDIITDIESNVLLKNYLTKLYNTDEVKNIFDDLKINNDDYYKITTFTRIDGDKTAKIVLTSDASEIYSYSMYEDYKLLKTKNGYINYKKDNQKNIIIINGNQYRIQIDYEFIKNKTIGKIKIDDKKFNKNIVIADYEYIINNKKENLLNINLSVKSKVLVKGKTEEVFVNSNISSDNKDIKDIEIKLPNKLNLRDSINDMFLKLCNTKKVKD